MPMKFISDELTDFLTDTLTHQKVNPLLLDKLDDEDRSLLAHISKLTESNLLSGYGLKEKKDNDYERFRLIQGSFMGGDNSPETLKELKHFILKFIGENKMNKREGYDILAQIAILAD